jgi:hypothetical protein
MGHSTTRAALIYQHVTSDRDRTIADRMCEAVGKALGAQEPPAEPGMGVAQPD